VKRWIAFAAAGSALACATLAAAASAASAAATDAHRHGGVAVDDSALPVGPPGLAEPMLTIPGGVPADRKTKEDEGAFRLLCNYGKMSYDDPIVYPGQPGRAHLHTFFGNNSITAATTPASIRAPGSKSGCRGGDVNLSGYWVPSMVDTASRKPIVPKYIVVYYKTGTGPWMRDWHRANKPLVMQPMPQGLVMIAGDASNANPDKAEAAFSCFTDAPGAGHRAMGSSIPACKPTEMVRMRIDFPQCWDGKNLDSPDHRSHMAKPVEWHADPDGQWDPSHPFKCPSTHPVLLPLLSEIIDWPVLSGQDTARWRLSSDTYDAALPGGYSAHADWMNGWDEEIKTIWTRECMQKQRDCGSFNVGDGRGAIEFQGN